MQIPMLHNIDGCILLDVSCTAQHLPKHASMPGSTLGCIHAILESCSFLFLSSGSHAFPAKRQGASADKLQLIAAKVLPLDGLAKRVQARPILIVGAVLSICTAPCQPGRVLISTGHLRSSVPCQCSCGYAENNMLTAVLQGFEARELPAVHQGGQLAAEGH